MATFSMDAAGNATVFLTKGFARLFYLVPPSSTYREDPEEVPNYITEAVPFFVLSIALEIIVGFARKRKVLRVNDGFSSIAAGLFQQVSYLFAKGIEMCTYMYVYEHFNYIKLSWDSPLTWWITFLAVDLGYYFFHRYAHEINILWAAHVVHHSSEDYNLTTALRQSILQSYTSWIFFLPLAVALPPSIFYTHRQFNTLYQFWIHTEIVRSLGPLEYILNTPSHHRVHHGRNRYCIDKNYGGTLIIWDRIFGTFAAENEQVVFGLTHPQYTWDPLWTQVHHLAHIWRNFVAIKGWRNKLSVLFKGPGWQPGTARLGDPNGIPDVKAPWPKYDRALPGFLNVYVILHFMLIVLAYSIIANGDKFGIPYVMVLALGSYVLFSLTTFGAMFDHKPYAFGMELTRIAVFLALELAFWFSHGDDFVFLWYREPGADVPLYVHRPLKAIRAFYIFSAMWLMGRYALFSFYGDAEKPVTTLSQTAPLRTGAGDGAPDKKRT
eukprot:Opistho-2@54679